MNLDKKVANRIFKLRQELNLTQEKLAEYSDIDVSSIAKIERGERANIKINTLEKILNGLQISATKFFDFENVTTKELIMERLNNKLKNKPDEKSLEYLQLFEQIIDISKK